MITCVYMIGIGSKRYYGSAVNFSSRVNQHLSKLKLGKHENGKLQNIVNKYGIECLQFSIIEIVEDKTQLLETEQKYLDIAKSTLEVENQLNILWVAGSRIGMQHSEETKQKMRNSHRQRYANRPPKVVIPKEPKIRTYKPMSPEQKKKLSLARKGVPVPALQKPRRKRGKQSQEYCDKVKQGQQNSTKKIGRPSKQRDVTFKPLFKLEQKVEHQMRD